MNASDFFLLNCGFQTYFMGQGTLWLKKKIKKLKLKNQTVTSFMDYFPLE